MRKPLSARIGFRIHLCFRCLWWQHFGSTNRWVEWLLGLNGGFDLILTDNGFLIKGQISADIETKEQISADIWILSTRGQTHEVLGGFVGRLLQGHNLEKSTSLFKIVTLKVENHAIDV